MKKVIFLFCLFLCLGIGVSVSHGSDEIKKPSIEKSDISFEAVAIESFSVTPEVVTFDNVNYSELSYCSVSKAFSNIESPGNYKDPDRISTKARHYNYTAGISNKIIFSLKRKSNEPDPLTEAQRKVALYHKPKLPTSRLNWNC